jgi:hypothetical protein
MNNADEWKYKLNHLQSYGSNGLSVKDIKHQIDNVLSIFIIFHTKQTKLDTN